MSEYNKYVLAVNKIFEVISKIKNNYSDRDNLNYIADIENYKQTVINAANNFSTKKESNMTKQPDMEELEERI